MIRGSQNNGSLCGGDSSGTLVPYGPLTGSGNASMLTAQRSWDRDGGSTLEGESSWEDRRTVPSGSFSHSRSVVYYKEDVNELSGSQIVKII